MVGKSFAKKEEEQTTNMMAEMFEAVWGAQFIDSHGDYARALFIFFCMCSVVTNASNAKKMRLQRR